MIHLQQFTYNNSSTAIHFHFHFLPISLVTIGPVQFGHNWRKCSKFELQTLPGPFCQLQTIADVIRLPGKSSSGKCEGGSLKLHVALCKSMQLYGALCSFMWLYAALCNSMQLFRVPFKSNSTRSNRPGPLKPLKRHHSIWWSTRSFVLGFVIRSFHHMVHSICPMEFIEFNGLIRLI